MSYESVKKELYEELYSDMTYEEWKATQSDAAPPQKIESGTEAPTVLMPGSPLADSKKEESISTTAVPVVMKESTDYAIPLVSAFCGFLVGLLVAFAFCQLKIKQVKKECEAKVGEARASLDRFLQMISQQ